MSISTQNTRLIATGIAIASSLSLAKPSSAQPTVHQTAEKTAQASTKAPTPALYK
ncbi:hypothetical protein ACF3N0_09870 [Moraxella atlantae]|uniref:hypothetical protein n=1 Tax=Faucicola atlantae TaxID=34059 RepID=UPI003753216D